MAVDEIIVKAKRPKGNIPMGPRPGAPRGAGPGGGPGFVNKRIRDMLIRMEVREGTSPPKKPPAVIPEVIVKAKKPIPKIGGFLGPLGAGALFVADIGAKLADAISQRSLDEAGRRATATDPPKWVGEFIDPTVTPPALAVAPVPEIVVTAKRPKPKLPTAFMPREFFYQEIGGRPVGTNFEPVTKTPIISAPKVDLGVKKKPKLPLVFPTFTTLPGRGYGTGSVTEPLPRSRLLGIGKPKLKVAAGGTGLAGAGTVPGFALATQTQPTLAGAGCQPCPKPKRKKPRSVCYRKMVNERRNRSNDETFKWEKIKCR